jgi:predicted Co/Zn/Cd cation transporter (cation efflux family)
MSANKVARAAVGGSEQSVLRRSIIATLLLAAASLVFGLAVHSNAILFDGMYSLVDATMTGLAFSVARLIAASNAADVAGRAFHERFTMGFWHLEPIVLGLNGTLMTGAALYALINAVSALLAGGHPLAFGAAMGFEGVATLLDIAMLAYTARANARLRSHLVALDSKAWGVGAALGLALFVSFLVGFLIQGTSLQWLAPYVDPAALALVSLVVIPVPLVTIRRAVADILMVTPQGMKDAVDAVAQAAVQRHGFLSFRAYVARVGRGSQIELYFIVPANWPARRLEDWDALRDEIGNSLGPDSPDRWLTIVFTTDPEWAN